MNTGILTFHKAYNYGAVLQAYALREILQELGSETELINYYPPFIARNNESIPSSRLTFVKRLIKKFLRPNFYYTRRVRHLSFDHFVEKQLSVTSTVCSGETIDVSSFETVVFGSDQIWNEKLTSNDLIFFGQFDKKDTKFISYAASMETSAIDEKQKRNYRNYLSSFDAISVRETQASDLLKPLTSVEVSTVLDPTLLLDSSEYLKIAKSSKISSPYIFLYLTFYDERAISIAKQKAHDLGLQLVSLSCSFQKIQGVKDCNSASPLQFLDLVAKASYVVTSSYHGTAFSLIFNKPFVYVETLGANTRVRSLLKHLDIEDRITSFSTFEEIELDYQVVNTKIKVLRDRSIKFLKQSL